MTGANATPSGEQQTGNGSARHADVGGGAENQLRVDLLNSFYTAYKSDIDEDAVDEAIEFARNAAREDAQ